MFFPAVRRKLRRSMRLSPIAISRPLLCCIICCATAGAFADALPNSPSQDAERELFAARYENAAKLYSDLVKQPAETDAWYGLVRSQLALHHTREAFAAADLALIRTPQSAGAQTAAGLAMYRRGEINKAENYFRHALEINPRYPGALRGLASIYSTVSMFKSARDLRLRAYKLSPEDPELMLAWANTLKKARHTSMLLEAALARFDPLSGEARALRVHIANDRAVGDRKLRRLVSPYENTSIKLFRILDGPTRLRGIGVNVRLNQKQTVKLLLDTGASGIALSPRLAEKAGLQVISGETSETKGVGDEKAQASLAYLAAEVRAGDVAFADFPIAVFRSAQSANYDGLIGADAFDRFLVKIDFVQLMMSLNVREEGVPQSSDELTDTKGPPPPGFYRLYRFGDHLAVPTLVNDTRSALFLLDSGSTANIIETDLAKEVTSVSANEGIVKGIQGKVDKVSRADRISLVFAGFRQDNPALTAIDLGEDERFDGRRIRRYSGVCRFSGISR